MEERVLRSAATWQDSICGNKTQATHVIKIFSTSTLKKDELNFNNIFYFM